MEPSSALPDKLAPIPSAHHFPHINDWLTVLDKNLNIPNDFLNKARRLRQELIATSAKTYPASWRFASR